MRWRRRRGVLLDIAAFLLTLFSLGGVYLVYNVIVVWLNTWQAAYYPSGTFIVLYLNVWAYGWAVVPAIIMFSAIIGLLVAAARRSGESRI